MKTASSETFYSDLPVHSTSLPELLSNEGEFAQIPEDWHIIITDIKNSTQAVLGGRHEDVNLIAVGSIVTVLNLAFSVNISLPFFFGGDGATFAVPNSLIDQLMEALALYRQTILTNFNLELRTGTVPVSAIYTKGHNIQIAKFKRSKSFSIPVVLGSGLDYAEKIIKGEDYLLSEHKPKQEPLDLTGMQCRWDKIPPPLNKEEIVTLLIISCDVKNQVSVFKKVLQKMDELYGAPDIRQPISVPRLKLKSTFTRLGKEMRLQLGRIKLFELIRRWLTTFYGYIYFNTRKGKTYLKSLVEMSDTLVIDGKINTVITGSISQRKALEGLLNKMEDDGEILYGLHSSGASIMSCYVRNLKDDHIHFVDGSEGGYTKAAKMLKAKFNKI